MLDTEPTELKSQYTFADKAQALGLGALRGPTKSRAYRLKVEFLMRTLANSL